MLSLKQLLQNSSEQARPDAVLLGEQEVTLLLAGAIKKNKEYIFAHPEYQPTIIERAKYAYYTQQRKRGYSVAVITHHKEFCGLDFYVNKHVLVPRPETELIVVEAKKVLAELKNESVALIDIGTGTGCIPISILKTLDYKNIKTYAVDISRRALRVARKNARTQNVFIAFFHGNLFEPVAKILDKKSEIANLVITANLPYLTEAQYDAEPSIKREPKLALVTRAHGLALYEELLQQLQAFLKNKRCTLTMFLEIDPSQAALIAPLVRQYLPAATLGIKKDLGGNNRIVKIALLS